MSNFSNKTCRKVRFNLPDIAPQFEKTSSSSFYSSSGRRKYRSEHGTVSYINGTLMNCKIRVPIEQQQEQQQQQKVSNVVTVTRIIKPISTSIPTTIHITTATAIPTQATVSVLKRSYENNNMPNLSSATQKQMADIDYRIRIPSSSTSSTSSSLSSMKKLYDINEHSKVMQGYNEDDTLAQRIEALKAKNGVVITNNPPVIKRKPVKMYDCQTICDKFSRFRLFEDILARKRKLQKADSAHHFVKREESLSTENVVNNLEQKPSQFTDNSLHHHHHHHQLVQNITKNLFSHENHTSIVSELVHRWKCHLNKSTAVTTANDYTNDSFFETALKFPKRFKRTDIKSLGCLKMNLDNDQPVTTLLRASRDADDDLLKIVFRKILIDGISKEALNATDKSGRTAISYICSTGLTNFLDILLQLPGIDVNKSDNEGNTPLHFAAQAGQADALNMMLTRCRNLQIDAKNCLGFTPLMKAALQGRTRCAKLLLFAGASPVETDSGRKLNAAEWAKFCGRDTCAEMLEKCTKVRQLEKSNSLRCSAKPNHTKNFTIMRSKTNPIQPEISESFRSKFKKFLPFGSNSQKDKDLKKRNQNKNSNKNMTTNNNNVNISNNSNVNNYNNNNTSNSSNSKISNMTSGISSSASSSSSGGIFNRGKNKNYENSTDLVNYLTNSAFCAGGPTAITTTLPLDHKRKITALIRPLEVPKLEITPANNQHLIKKYEDKMKREKNQSNGINTSPRMLIRN